MNDLISRQAVLDLAKKGVLVSNGNYESVCKAINEIPSVNPYPKTGHWIVHEKPHGIRYLECPYCNVWYLNEHLIRNSYCPNCGAKMVELQESEGKG